MVISPCIGISVTWHLTRDMRHRDIAGVVSTTAPVLSRHDVTVPHCVPRLLWFSFHHISHDEADLFLKISRSLPSSILPKQMSPGDTWYTWCHRDQVMSHGTLETWRASPLMRCHNDTGARVIYRGLESAKLSRSRGLPSRTTQRHRHNQTHKNTSINFPSSNRVNFDSWPGRADGLNNIH